MSIAWVKKIVEAVSLLLTARSVRKEKELAEKIQTVDEEWQRVDELGEQEIAANYHFETGKAVPHFCGKKDTVRIDILDKAVKP